MTDRRDDIVVLVLKYRKAIMGIAALSILFFHEYVPLLKNSFWLVRIQELIRGYGYIGVDIFFLLSGMGLVYSIQKNSLGEYYYRRFKRLVLPFIVVALIIMFVDQWSIERFIYNVFGIAFFTESIYAFLWFVPAISILYILFPLYHNFYIKQKNKLIFTAIIITFWALLSLVFSHFIRDDFYCFINRIPIFLIGIHFGWLSQKSEIIISKQIWRLLLYVMILGLYLVASILYFGMPRLVPIFEYGIPSVFIAIPLVFFLAKFFSVIADKRIGKYVYFVLCFVGKMSLEMYCIQEFLGNKIIIWLTGKANSIIINIIVLIITVLSGYLLYLLGLLFWSLIDKIRLFVKKDVCKRT